MSELILKHPALHHNIDSVADKSLQTIDLINTIHPKPANNKLSQFFHQ